MSTRRVFIKQLSAVAGVGLTASLGVSLHGHAEAALNPAWRMPDEGSRSSGHFAFGAQRAIWGEFTADAGGAGPYRPCHRQVSAGDGILPRA